MAKLEGMFQISGKVGNLVFYKTRKGFAVRSRPHINSARIKKAPEYERTRQNMSDFSTAAKANKLLRDALRVFLSDISDGSIMNRLTKVLMEIIKSDPFEIPGQR